MKVCFSFHFTLSHKFMNLHSFDILSKLVIELALLMAECREILSSAYQRQDNPRTWKDRMESLEESWSERREELFEVALECETLSSSVCEMCGERDSLIECKDCEIWGLCLCEICDDEKHSCKPLHNRRSSTNGFLQSIAPTKLCQGMNEFTEKGWKCLILYVIL